MTREGYHRGPRFLHADIQPTALTVANPLRFDRIPVPEAIWYEQGPPGPPRIGWRVGGQRFSPRVIPCLRNFTQLADAPDAKIVAFAERWGYLGICQHGRPWLHEDREINCTPLDSSHRTWEDPLTQLAWLRRHSGDLDDPYNYRSAHWEPIAAWRLYARAMRAILSLAAAIQRGAPTRPQDWRDAHTGRELASWESLADEASWDVPASWSDLRSPDFNPQGNERREKLSFLVNGLFRVGNVLPFLAFDDATPRVTLGSLSYQTQSGAEPWDGPYLFGVLVCQLAAAITSPAGVFNCSWCQQAYALTPEERRPRSDRSHFCSDECRHEAAKASDLASWHRRKPVRRRGRTRDQGDVADGNLDGNRSHPRVSVSDRLVET